MSSAQQLVALVGGIVGIATTVVVTFVAMLNYRLERGKAAGESRAQTPAAQALDQLAGAVARQWRDEERRRRVLDPFPLPVRWSNAREELFDHWSNIRRLPPGTPASPLQLSSRFEKILETFQLIPSGRLVILGGPGSGKTVLAMRFVLDYIAHRHEFDPVPVIFRLESWNPENVAFDEWLAGRLAHDYPALGLPTSGGPTVAAGFIEAGWILPVLDGFDEMAPGLHQAALDALNAVRMPLLLTSRPGEYERAADGGEILTSAAAIRLAGLTVDELADYLPRTVRKSSAGGVGAAGAAAAAGTTTRWDTVLARLRHPVTPEEQTAAEVLSVPLMVGLARVIYGDSRSRNPAELLEPGRFSSREALEDHLLDAFVPTVYRRTQRHTQQRWPVARAERWLENLALSLDTLRTRDLAWWQLRDTVPPLVRVVVGALTGLAGAGLLLWPLWKSGTALGFGSGFGTGIATIRGGREPIRAAMRFSGRQLHLLSISLAGASGGIAGGEVSGLLDRSHGFAVRFLTAAGRDFGPVSITGLAVGFVAGFVIARVGSVRLIGTRPQLAPRPRMLPDAIMVPLKCAALGLLAGLVGGAALGLAGGLALGTAGGLAAGLTTGLETAVDVTAAPSPIDLLRADRGYAIHLMVLFGLTVAISVGLVVWLVAGPAMGLAVGIGSGLVDGIGVALGFTAWGQWLVFTRAGLLLTGRIPRALPDFLADAHQRDVLRQAGATYQFRHARLQDRLAYRAAQRTRPERTVTSQHITGQAVKTT